MPHPKLVLAAVDAAVAMRPRDKARTYIGASAVGHECDAYLALTLRGFPNDAPEPRTKRIFQLGHHLEEVVVQDLKDAGIPVLEVDHTTGKQWTYSTFEGHSICHLDGIIPEADDALCGLEIKSMNQAFFSQFQKHGVVASHPHYYAQMQAMMGMSGIRKFLFVAYCKNDSAYHAEIVEFNLFYWSAIQYRIERVIKDEEIHRYSDNPESFTCQGCHKRSSCWEGLQPTVKECRHCRHSLPGKGGTWWCGKYHQTCVATCGDFEIYKPKEKVR